MLNPTTAAEIVKHFPTWKYDTHGWFECVWCHAFTNAKTISYSDPKPGAPVGHIEAEDVTAHKSDCPLASIAVNIDAYARQQVEAFREWIIQHLEARRKHYETARDEFALRECWTNHALYAERAELLAEEVAAIRALEP